MNCPRCDAPSKTEILRQFGGVCERCLLDFAAERDAPGFPNLEIVKTLGEGGMGVVYQAVQKPLGRTVALKVLSPALAGDPAFVERFTREARALAQLSHPNIVGIHDFGIHDGVPYLVMEHVDGTSLRKLLASRKLSAERALEVVPQICDALAYAHSRGVVHRDIKPENVLLDREGRVKIADFGLAKLAEPEQTRITRTDMLMGTPQYMAPEQVENPNRVDHRADIYSLGVIFYEMLTGELPIGRFKAPSERADVDRRLDPVVLKSLEKAPEDRFQSAGAMKDRVTRLEAAPEAVPAGGRRWGLIALLCLAGGVALFVLGVGMKAKGELGLTLFTGIAGLSLSCAGCAVAGLRQPRERGMSIAALIGFFTLLLPMLLYVAAPVSRGSGWTGIPWVVFAPIFLALAAGALWAFAKLRWPLAGKAWLLFAVFAVTGAVASSGVPAYLGLIPLLLLAGALVLAFAALFLDRARGAKVAAAALLLLVLLSVPLLFLSRSAPMAPAYPNVSSWTSNVGSYELHKVWPAELPPGLRLGTEAEHAQALRDAGDPLRRNGAASKVIRQVVMPGRVLVVGLEFPRKADFEAWLPGDGGTLRWSVRKLVGEKAQIALYHAPDAEAHATTELLWKSMVDAALHR